ncbi:MAG: BCAM0308 family protein [Desulfuromonadaceae bacterium]|nr:BCAM0308 family protein [Desulfuromonadaceae bacterium]
MVNTARRTEEKGQRTPRNLDSYKESGGVKGGGYCGCGATFSSKRWRHGERGELRAGGEELVCPACRRIADHNPAGIVSLSGSYFTEHKAEIENQIKNNVEAEFIKNPLGRIMETVYENNGVTITTTDEKLAEKIGRDVFKSHAGELNITWSDADSPVRVRWSR